MWSSGDHAGDRVRDRGFESLPGSVDILGFFFTFVFCHIAEAIDAARRCLLIFISFLFFPHAFISPLFLFSRLMMDSAGAHTVDFHF